MPHPMSSHPEDDPVLYRCARCGSETSEPGDAARGYCPICGCYAEELATVPNPAAATVQSEPVTGVHRLPVA